LARIKFALVWYSSGPIQPQKWGREAMAEGKTIDPHLVAEIVGRYVAHNTVAPD
jgi:hypothetical protein